MFLWVRLQSDIPGNALDSNVRLKSDPQMENWKSYLGSAMCRNLSGSLCT